MGSWENNLILLTDSYKTGHYKQYPPGMTRMKAYFESRGGQFDSVIFFGLQYILERWLSQTITMEMIENAEAHFRKHFIFNPDIFNKNGWISIVKDHNGKLPLKIKAVREGSLIPVKNVLFTVENTVDGYHWLVSYVESVLMHVWYPMTVCTNSFLMKKSLLESINRTCDNAFSINFKLHDFGFRGVSSVETAAIGGCAHLVNFSGTDNNVAIALCRQYYSEDPDYMPAFSGVASEHSVMTAWGPKREKEALEHILDEFSNTMASAVCDSYDLDNFLEKIVGDPELKAKIAQRAIPFVFRPDSGDPIKIMIDVLEKLDKIFSSRVNSKGFRVLPDNIRIIQGDGVSRETLIDMLECLEKNQWSVDNIGFGSGGALLQQFNRDTQKCAFKACSAIINGQEVDIFKDPATDAGKMSKPGDLTLVKTKDQQIVTKRMRDILSDDEELLEVVFENGHLTKKLTMEQIRETVNQILESSI